MVNQYPCEFPNDQHQVPVMGAALKGVIQAGSLQALTDGMLVFDTLPELKPPANIIISNLQPIVSLE